MGKSKPTRYPTLILMWPHDEYQLLCIEAAKQGITVSDLVGRHCDELVEELEIEAALERPEEAPFKLDGAVADERGSAALTRAARRRGLHFEVVGGTRHDGKVFGGG